MIYENGVFTIKTLTGDVILTHKLYKAPPHFSTGT